ncbi:MAG: serine/threonine-protein kinase [Oscillospiraceae bacterium]|nr:serine/threonine-protein kinase [Oscillospiraceae bacterium]
MGELSKGQKILTKNAKKLKVIERLGEGGQGIVYRVEYGKDQMALKWYYKNKLRDPAKFYQNIENNISRGRPADAFLWPVDITEWVGGTFGYIMPLRPDQYGDFSDYLLAKKQFGSVRALINAALHIVDAFDALHKMGYNYQDLNDGNFFVDYETGDVLICDNDNVMGHGFSSGIAGKCRYMAPEIVIGKKTPDKQTDRYSLAVVLFLLLFVNHPLEGKATNPPCMTEELERQYYGTDPVFIFDPHNKSNTPVTGIHRNAIKKWPIFPQYVRDQFIAAFSYDQLHTHITNKPRLLDSDWMRMFIRLRSEIVTCGCGSEVFADPTAPVVCPGCSSRFTIPAFLKFKKINLPLLPGTNLYPCHTMTGSGDFINPSAEVVVSKNNPASMGIRNLSESVWYAIGADQKQIPKAKGEVVKIASGIKINFGKNTEAEIIGN